jgi:hypothetical protein
MAVVKRLPGIGIGQILEERYRHLLCMALYRPAKAAIEF